MVSSFSQRKSFDFFAFFCADTPSDIAPAGKINILFCCSPGLSEHDIRSVDMTATCVTVVVY